MKVFLSLLWVGSFVYINTVSASAMNNWNIGNTRIVVDTIPKGSEATSNNSKMLGPENKFSENVTKQKGKKLRRQYRRHGNVLRTVNDKSHRRRTLKFEFDASSVQEVLTKNYGGYATPDTMVLMFGLELKPKGKKWYGIIYGLKNDRLLDSEDRGNYYASIFANAARSDTSSRQSKTQAYALRARYACPGNILETTDGEGKPFDLQGVSFESKHIQEILTENGSGLTPDKVVFYFGLEESKGAKQWHIVAYGKKDKKLLDFYKAHKKNDGTSSSRKYATRASIYDKADPYPPRN